MTHPQSVQERNEIIQNLIDRLLYLPEEDLKKFNEHLDTLFYLYDVKVQIVDGIRIYNTTKKK